MKRIIAVFTSTRAEYGLLRSVLLPLRDDPNVELQVLVGGTHLSPAHGRTIHEIKCDALPITACIPTLPEGDSQSNICGGMGQALAGLGRCLDSNYPDMLLLLGDRWETFCAAAAAAICRIPIAHIHGGEITAGAVDDALRHAITKMSHWHFVTCEEHRRRVIQLGESPDRVWNTGALGVENALTLPLPSEEEIRNFLGLGTRPYIVCTFHPPTLEPGQEEAQLAALLDALHDLELQRGYDVVFTAANADAGGDTLNYMLTEWATKSPFRHFVASLGVVRYLATARYADCVVGNSSSGVLEVPSLGTPVVNVGCRQQGRVCSEAVLHCAPTRAAIGAALTRALTAEHRKLARHTANPHAGKDTALTIARILRTHPLEDILHKRFHDIPLGESCHELEKVTH